MRRRLVWVTIVLLVVSLPLVLFALMGLPHFFRGPLVRNVIAREAGGEPPAVASAHFAPAFALLTGTTLMAGNTVEVLANGDATFPPLWRDLRSARRSITVQMYYAGPGAVADSATRILAERARGRRRLFPLRRVRRAGAAAALPRCAARGGGPRGRGPTGAALVHSPPLTGSTAAERLLAFSISSARRRLYVANAYFIPHADFVQLLVDAAQRGVDVRILTNSARTDVRSTWLAGRSRYETLLAGGVRIYEYQPVTIHAKTFVVDGRWSVVSTMNFDNRSLAYNNEVALVALDSAVGATMEALFLDDLRVAEEIRLETFRRRPRMQRLLERVASVLAGLL